MSQKIEVKLQLSKSTKGTHVYKDDSPSAPIPTLYIKREAIEGLPATVANVTITF